MPDITKELRSIYFPNEEKPTRANLHDESRKIDPTGLEANLETIHPGVWDCLCEGKDLNPHITVIVDGEGSGMGLYEPLQEDSEVHFLPAMEGG